MSPDTLFGSASFGLQLEQLNAVFWQSLLQHLHREVQRNRIRSILDIGCHRGGLLELLSAAFRPQRICGLEPLEGVRQQARFRLKGKATEIRILEPERWSELPSGEQDLVTCHEVLHLVADLESWMILLAASLRPSASAYVVLGCHSENPLWSKWKPRLQAEGHEVFDHRPEDILAKASACGLETAIRPLRRNGWVFYDPRVEDFRYDSMGQMFDHHYRHKLLFRFTRPGS